MDINPEGQDCAWAVTASRTQEHGISAGWRVSPERVTCLKPWAGQGAELSSADNKGKMLYVLQAHCFWAPRPKDHSYKNRKVLSNLPPPLKERMERRKIGKFILKTITWGMALLEKGQLLACWLDQGKLRDNSNVQVFPEKKNKTEYVPEDLKLPFTKNLRYFVKDGGTGILKCLWGKKMYF